MEIESKNRPRRTPPWKTPLALLYRSVLLGMWVVSASAQMPVVEDPTPETLDLAPASNDTGESPESDPQLWVAVPDLEGGWVEVTPLGDTAPSQVFVLEGRREATEPTVLEPGLGDTQVMACSGGGIYGITCESLYLDRRLGAVEVRFEEGMEVRGRYLAEGRPVAAARVSVVPAASESERPFLVPLSFAEETSKGELARHVETDAEGAFRLPPLAEGDYFLEILPPGGRLYRGDPFSLPAPALLRAQLGAEESELDESAERVYWDLGDLGDSGGLTLTLRVVDDTGAPVVGARVSATQGRSAADLRSFRGVADADGVATLSGFSVEEPTRLSCEAPGHLSWSEEPALLPVEVECVLERWAVVEGEIRDSAGEVPPGATLSLVRRDPDTPSADLPPAKISTAGEGGSFRIPGLAAGSHELTAVAPGYEITELELEVEPGQLLSLGTLTLPPGRELRGRVRDEGTGEPLVADVTVVSPPGGGGTTSDEDGEFRLDVARQRELRLRVSAPGYASSRVTVLPGIDDPLEVALGSGGQLRVVILSDGLPCQGCRVRIPEADLELTTDALGTVEVDSLEPGDYRVERPRLENRGSVVVEQSRAEVKYARILAGEMVIVRFGDRRRQTLRVRLRPTPAAGWQLGLRTPRRTTEYSQESDGSFLVELEEGEVPEVFLRFFDPVSGADAEVRHGTLRVEERAIEGIAVGEIGGLRETTLLLHDTLVHGRAREREEALPGVLVRLLALENGAAHATVRTDPEGHFRIPHIAPGVYSLTIGNAPVKFVSIPTFQAVDLGTFEMVPGGY